VEISDSNNNLSTANNDTKEKQEVCGFQKVVHYVLEYLDEPAPSEGAYTMHMLLTVILVT